MATVWLQTGIAIVEVRPPVSNGGTGSGGSALPSVWINRFLDVNETDWFYNAVDFVNSNGTAPLRLHSVLARRYHGL